MPQINQLVIEDLIDLYHAGEASEETVIFLNEWMNSHPEKSYLLKKSKDPHFPKIDIPELKPDGELKLLRNASRLMRLRSASFIISILFLFLSVRFEFFMVEKVIQFFRENPTANAIGISLFIIFMIIYVFLQMKLRIKANKE